MACGLEAWFRQDFPWFQLHLHCGKMYLSSLGVALQR